MLCVFHQMWSIFVETPTEPDLLQIIFPPFTAVSVRLNLYGSCVAVVTGENVWSALRGTQGFKGKPASFIFVLTVHDAIILTSHTFRHTTLNALVWIFHSLHHTLKRILRVMCAFVCLFSAMLELIKSL